LSGQGGNVTVPAQNATASQANSPTSSPPASLGQTSIPATAAQSLPASLRQSIPQASAEMKAIKGLDQYRSTAQRVPVPFIGTTVDVTN
jgi:hypothetical protein